jgi:pyruvate formate lyase activating enzyme
VAFTYNDPVIFHEFAIDAALACHERGVKTVAVTAGYQQPGARLEFFRFMDGVNVDLKGFTDDFYRRLCGGHLAPVLDTLRYLVNEANVWLEVTTLLIPGENDSDDEIHRECEWIASQLGLDVPLHFTAFHPAWRMMNVPPTPLSALTRARFIARQYGLRYIYTGNVHDPDGGRTVCHNCGSTLIARDWHSIKSSNLTDDGRCRTCGTPCAGVFEQRPFAETESAGILPGRK